METRSGKVNNTLVDRKVSPKTGKPYTVHRVQLDNGDEIETGFKQPYKVGDSFNSEVEFAYGKWKEVKALGSAPVAASTTSVPTNSYTPPAPMAFPIPKANKETAIIRQNALTNAVTVVRNFLNDGGPSVPAQSLDEYTDTVISTAYKFAEFSSGQREIRLSKELTNDSTD